MVQDHHDRCSSPPASTQAAIKAARAQLLAGRGPGASPREITRHTRARLRLGGYPTSQRREQLAAHTALARGDPDALTQQGTTTGDQPTATIEALHHKINPTPPVGALQLALTAATLGAILGAAATATVHHHLHHNR